MRHVERAQIAVELVTVDDLNRRRVVDDRNLAGNRVDRQLKRQRRRVGRVQLEIETGAKTGLKRARKGRESDGVELAIDGAIQEAGPGKKPIADIGAGRGEHVARRERALGNAVEKAF